MQACHHAVPMHIEFLPSPILQDHQHRSNFGNRPITASTGDNKSISYIITESECRICVQFMAQLQLRRWKLHCCKRGWSKNGRCVRITPSTLSRRNPSTKSPETKIAFLVSYVVYFRGNFLGIRKTIHF